MSEDIECTNDYAVGYRAGWKDATARTADRIEALESALDECKAQLESNTAVMTAGAARIKALEVEAERWHRIAMEAGAITCSDGRHIYPRRERIEKLEKALRDIADLHLYPEQHRERARAALAPETDK